MTSTGAATAGHELETVRALVNTATQHLLGNTITVTDENWRGPSRLPGWTRGHVATHLARQADGLVRLTEWARTGRRQEMYATPTQREDDIAAGAGRSGLELQIDLDTSAGALAAAFDALDDGAWDALIELRGGRSAPARLLPLVRLAEVVLHHVDLNVGFGMDDIEADSAEWLLEWVAFRLHGRDDFPALRVEANDSDFAATLGASSEPTTVRGTSRHLLGWLTGRAGPESVEGAGGQTLPAF